MFFFFSLQDMGSGVGRENNKDKSLVFSCMDVEKGSIIRAMTTTH